MANVKFVNNASTKLASALTSSGTTCTVLQDTGDIFPTLDTDEFFVGVIVDPVGNLEVVYVTDKSDDTFTITRAQENTTALDFPAGSFFENRLTAGSLTALQTQITGVSDWVTSTTATAESVASEQEASVTRTDNNFHFAIPRAADGATPIGLSLAKMSIDANSGHLTFTVHQCDFDTADAYINESGNLILQLNDNENI